MQRTKCLIHKVCLKHPRITFLWVLSDTGNTGNKTADRAEIAYLFQCLTTLL